MKRITQKDLDNIKRTRKDGEDITIETLEELSNGKGDDEDE